MPRQWIESNGVITVDGFENTEENLASLGTDSDIIDLINSLPGDGDLSSAEQPVYEEEGVLPGVTFSNAPEPTFSEDEDSNWQAVRDIEAKRSEFENRRREAAKKPIQDPQEYADLLTPAERLSDRIGTTFVKDSVDLFIQKPFQVMEAFNKSIDKSLSHDIAEGMKERGLSSKEDIQAYLAQGMIGDPEDPLYQAENHFRKSLEYISNFDSVEDEGTVYKQIQKKRHAEDREGSFGWVHKKLTNEKGEIDVGPQALKVLNKVSAVLGRVPTPAELVDKVLPGESPISKRPARDPDSINIFSKEFHDALAIDANGEAGLVENFIKDKFGIEIKGKIRPEGYVMPLLDFGADLGIFALLGQVPGIGGALTGAAYQGQLEAAGLKAGKFAGTMGKRALRAGLGRQMAQKLGIGKATQGVVMDSMKNLTKLGGRGAIAAGANTIAGVPLNYAYALDDEGNFNQDAFNQGLIADAAIGFSLGGTLAGAEMALTAFSHAKANSKLDSKTMPKALSQVRGYLNKAWEGMTTKVKEQKQNIEVLKKENAAKAAEAAPKEAPIEPNVTDVDEIARIQEEQRLLNEETQQVPDQALETELKQALDEELAAAPENQPAADPARTPPLEEPAATPKTESVKSSETVYRTKDDVKPFVREDLKPAQEIELLNKELTSLKSDVNLNPKNQVVAREWDRRIRRLDELGVKLDDPLYKFEPKPKKVAPKAAAKKVVPASKQKGTTKIKASEPELPRDLKGSKPRYSYGDKRYTTEFQTDAGKALYVVAQKNPSKRDADFMKFLKGHEKFKGLDDNAIREIGQKLRNEVIKPLAREGDGGVLKIAKQYEQFLPKPVKTKPVVPKSVKKGSAKSRKLIDENFDNSVVDNVFNILHTEKLNKESLLKNFDIHDGQGKSFYKNYTTKQGGRQLDDVIEEAISISGNKSADALEIRNQVSELIRHKHGNSPLDYFRNKKAPEAPVDPKIDRSGTLRIAKTKSPKAKGEFDVAARAIEDGTVEGRFLEDLKPEASAKEIVTHLEKKFKGKNIKTPEDARVAYDYRMEKSRQLSELLDDDSLTPKQRYDIEQEINKQFTELENIPEKQRLAAEEMIRKETHAKDDLQNKQKVEAEIDEAFVEGDSATKKEIIDTEPKKGDYDCN